MKVVLSWFCKAPALFAAFALLSLQQAPAQDSAIAGLFPDPDRIARDYPDEAERYVVFNLLWDVCHEKAPSAKQKRAAYYDAGEAIRMGQRTEGFDNRTQNLASDKEFKRSVLEKYGLNLLPVERPTALPLRNTTVTDAMIKRACLAASPFAFGSLLAMMWLVRRAVRKASQRSSVSPPLMRALDDLPTLPESLRVVSVPLLQYSVDLVSALALEKETKIETRYATSTSGGEVYTIGNQVYSTPVRTSTSVSTTQHDLVWVHTSANQETSWTFTGGTFRVRAGQILSAITRRVGEGTSAFLLAYNHNTGQLEQFEEVHRVHRTRGGLGWLLATAVGSVGFGIAFGIILSIQPDADNDPVRRLLSPLVDWIMGAIVSAVIAVPLLLRAKSNLARERASRFQRDYLPGYRKFLEQLTPAARKHFGQGQATS